MKKSNYDIMRDQAETEFLNYDQDKMIAKFNLDCDVHYIYISFVGRQYRINRSNGRVEWFDKNRNQYIHSGYNETMTIFDVLCYSKDYCCLSGEYMSINNVPGVVQSSAVGQDFFSGYTNSFEHKLCELSNACESLGGVKEKVGDVAYRINMFEFLPIVLQYWDSDEEFPPMLKIMWDKNIINYMHYETTYFAASHLLKRIQELVDSQLVTS